jgi:hypothetical protein
MKRMNRVAGIGMLACGLFSGVIQAQTVVGDWQGMLPNWKSRCVLKIVKGDDGKLSANLYVIYQSPEPHPADSVTFDGTYGAATIPKGASGKVEGRKGRARCAASSGAGDKER